MSTPTATKKIRAEHALRWLDETCRGCLDCYVKGGEGATLVGCETCLGTGCSTHADILRELLCLKHGEEIDNCADCALDHFDRLAEQGKAIARGESC